MDLIVSIVIHILAVTLIFLVILVNMKLYKNTKREEHNEKGKIVQSIIKHFAFVQCFALPVIVFWYLTIVFNDYLQNIPLFMSRYWFYGYSFFYGIVKDYIGFNSLIVAIVRYTFLIHEAKAEKIGVKKLKKFFVYASFIVPIGNSFLFESTVSVHWWIISLNNTRIEDAFRNPLTNRTYESPLYYTMHQILPTPLVQTLTSLEISFLFIFYSNILEGFLYARAMIYYRRYAK